MDIDLTAPAFRPNRSKKQKLIWWCRNTTIILWWLLHTSDTWKFFLLSVPLLSMCSYNGLSLAWRERSSSINVTDKQLTWHCMFTFCVHKIRSGSVVSSVQAMLFLIDCSTCIYKVHEVNKTERSKFSSYKINVCFMQAHSGRGGGRVWQLVHNVVYTWAAVDRAWSGSWDW